MHVRLPIAAAACAALLASTSALAQSASASVDLSQFSYQLIDLDLTDSITPAISFTERMVSTSYHDNGSGAIDYQEIETFGATAIGGPSGSASTSSSATASSVQAGFTLAAPAFQLYAGQHFHGWDFEVTPSTGILFSTRAVLNAAHAGDQAYAKATATMVGYLFDYADGAVEQSDFTDLVAIENGTRNYTLSGYLHSGTQALKGSFGMGTDATAAFWGASPVPEPSTYAMLLAGLGLLGWRARRRAGV